MIRERPESVLVVGGGGRESALAWKLNKDHIPRLFVAPGNPGTAQIATNLPVEPDDIEGLVGAASDYKIDLTLVGPENPLAEGVVDLFEENRKKIFGPNQIAAQLETSKSWAVRFMDRHNIPYPASYIFTNSNDALAFIDEAPWQEMVVKGDGLAAGKAVSICDTHQEAIGAIKRIMIAKEFGEAGSKVVIQEKLIGKEASILAFSDGKTVVPLLSAADHKPIFDGNKGRNTGGMGAYAPVPYVTPELLQTIQETILQPTIDGMREENAPYKGVLYAGLMMTQSGPKVLEFNARFGDPETQPLMLLLASDLASILVSCIEGTLDKNQIAFHDGYSVCVVLAAAGYPGKPQKGEVIQGLQQSADPNIQIFHAGTLIKNGQVVTNGGRVLGITAYGKDLIEASKRVYDTIGDRGIHFQGMHYRKDIGKMI